MRIVLGIAFGIALLISCNSNRNETGFIKVKGTHFELNGKPYYFMGTNLWYGANLAAEGQRDRLIRELDHLQSLGITNLRIMGASEGAGENRIRKSFQPKLGVYDEELLEGLDFLLVEMSKRDMVAVIFLNNFWVWTGGMSQYMSWIQDTPVPNPFLEEYTWDEFMNFSATFYQSESAIEANRKYLEKIILRRNSISGIPYVDDPSIMSWQLANEPRPGRGQKGLENVPAYLDWIDKTARYIHELDPNHLVSTGNEGLAGSLWDEQAYLNAHRLPSIDYMTMHLWILNWSWYDPEKPEATYPDALNKVLDYISSHITFAEQLNKPITLEEFGIPRDNHAFSPDAGTIWRDQYYSRVFDVLYLNVREKGPVAGSNFWGWGGEGKPADSTFAWEPGDDFVGDPPQEPQGRNSVFDTDTTTLEVISEYARKMNQLCDGYTPTQ